MVAKVYVRVKVVGKGMSVVQYICRENAHITLNFISLQYLLEQRQVQGDG